MLWLLAAALQGQDAGCDKQAVGQADVGLSGCVHGDFTPMQNNRWLLKPVESRKRWPKGWKSCSSPAAPAGPSLSVPSLCKQGREGGSRRENRKNLLVRGRIRITQAVFKQVAFALVSKQLNGQTASRLFSGQV